MNTTPRATRQRTIFCMGIQMYQEYWEATSFVVTRAIFLYSSHAAQHRAPLMKQSTRPQKPKIAEMTSNFDFELTDWDAEDGD